MNRLKLCKYNFTMRFTQETVLPPFVGNTLRGALGQSLYHRFPPLYESIFKTQSAVSCPNPFVIDAPYPGKRVYQAGDTLNFAVTLFGAACDFGGRVVMAVRGMCRGKLDFGEIIEAETVYECEWSDAGAESIPVTDTLTLHFLTPTEILSGKIRIAELGFDRLIDSLFGRICGMIDTYTDSRFTIPYALAAAKPYVRAAYDLEFPKIVTNGQPINGFVGTINYFGDMTAYMPYIDLGSQLHIGKKATRSCGQYSFEI